MIDQVRTVAQLRNRVQDLKAAEDTAYQDFLRLRSLDRENLEEARAQLAMAETVLRDAALQEFARTGNKAPAPGVGIRVLTKLVYDLRTAYDWALEHKVALELDVPIFEKLAKAAPPEFVQVKEEPQATIATDLDKVLAAIS